MARQIEFPGKYSLGSLYAAPESQPESFELLDVPQGLITKPENQPINWEWLDEARGTIDIPEGVKLKLKVSPAAIDILCALADLPGDGIHTLDMSRTPVQDAQLINLERLKGLKVLELAYTAISNTGIEILSSLTSLHTLGLTNTAISNSGLSPLCRLTNLKELWLNGTLIDDEGAELVVALKELRLLGLSSTNFTDAGLAVLSRLPNLLRVYMFNTQISGEGAAQLRKQLPACRVKWRRCQNIRPEFMDADDAYLELDEDLEDLFKRELLQPMNDDEFWPLIDLLDWDSVGDDKKVIEPCVQALAKMSESEIIAFEEALCAKLYKLDAKKFATNIGKESYRGKDQPFSKSWFLNARCCVVANGRELYEQVLENPKSMPKDLEFNALAKIARVAFKRKTGCTLSHVTKLSKETFSNFNGWTGI
ncbi:MAG: DUF4240 domain-containing protein [Candidatus Obscuribacterales bacterium]|nr:DUF4240 domain-containing protein [Candidatus Obscuribacterales bacterium]